MAVQASVPCRVRIVKVEVPVFTKRRRPTPAGAPGRYYYGLVPRIKVPQMGADTEKGGGEPKNQPRPGVPPHPGCPGRHPKAKRAERSPSARLRSPPALFSGRFHVQAKTGYLPADITDASPTIAFSVGLNSSKVMGPNIGPPLTSRSQ